MTSKYSCSLLFIIDNTTNNSSSINNSSCAMQHTSRSASESCTPVSDLIFVNHVQPHHSALMRVTQESDTQQSLSSASRTHVQMPATALWVMSHAFISEVQWEHWLKLGLQSPLGWHKSSDRVQNHPGCQPNASSKTMLLHVIVPWGSIHSYGVLMSPCQSMYHDSNELFLSPSIGDKTWCWNSSSGGTMETTQWVTKLSFWSVKFRFNVSVSLVVHPISWGGFSHIVCLWMIMYLFLF